VNKTVMLVSVVVIGIVVLPPLMARLFGSDLSTPSVSERAAGAVLPQEEPVEPAPNGEPRPHPVMTSEQFFQIQSHTTYEQCIALVGTEGEVAEPASSGDSGVTASYKWYDPAGTTQFVLGFRDGVLAGKQMEKLQSRRAQRTGGSDDGLIIESAEVERLEQAAVRAGLPVTVTIEEFNRIRPGMTYDECVAVIGAENPMAQGYAGQRNAVLANPRGSSQTLEEGYRWPNPGGYYAEIAFLNGRVTTKTWKKGSGGHGGTARGSGGGRPRR